MKYVLYLLTILPLFYVNASLQDDIGKYQNQKHTDGYYRIREGKEVSNLLLNTTGEIPKWLNGTYIRNGSGKYKVDDQIIWHFFDGLAYLISFKFEDGKIYFSSKFLKSAKYESLMNNEPTLKKKNTRAFAQNYERIKNFKYSNDGQKVFLSNANINLIQINNKYVALGETPLPVEFDKNTLNTLGMFDFNDKLYKSEIWEWPILK